MDKITKFNSQQAYNDYITSNNPPLNVSKIIDNDSYLVGYKHLYRRIEYIENTSTAYIDTGIKGSGGQRVECIFMPITQLSTKFNCVYGARTTAGSKHDGIYIYSNNTSNNVGYVAYNTTNKNGLASAYASLNEMHEIIQDKGTFTLDGNLVYSFTNATFTCTTATIYIFNGNNNGSLADYRGLFRLYSFKLYNSSNVLVRDMIPVQRISDLKYGLYDKVGNDFYISPNGVEFVYNPET